MYRVTFLYQQSTDARRVGGWSENWYLDADEATATRGAGDYIRRRGALLCGQASCVGFRLQVLGGRSKMVLVNTPGPITSGQDIPQMALNCRVSAQGVPNVKYFQLRGLPDANVIGGDFVPVGGFGAAFSAFGSCLWNNSFRFRVRSAAIAPVQVISIDANGNFVLGGNLTFGVGAYIQILRVRTVTGANASGTFYVDVATDSRRGRFIGWQGGVVTLSGTARVYSTDYVLVANSSLESLRVTTRKVGRPFDMYRGRRRRRSSTP